jgi:superfamily I DNA/RNA helicase
MHYLTILGHYVGINPVAACHLSPGGAGKESPMNQQITTTPAPSVQQAAILQWIGSRTTGSLVVEAVAGSGKTTTLRMIAGALRDKGHGPDAVLYLAFSKAMVEEIGPRLAGLATVRTIHSHGFAALRKAHRGKLDSLKARNLQREVLDGDATMLALPDGERLTRARACMDLLSKSMLGMSGTSLPEVEAIIDHYGIDLDPQWAAPRLAALVAANDAAIRRGSFSFDDMIAAPARMGMAVEQFPVVLVDEAQDLSPAQRAIALASVAPGGMAIFVGDPRQAIFGFAGATCESIREIVEATGADTLPLAVTYRCPASHVGLARQIVPGIKAAPGAKTGILQYLDDAEAVPGMVQRGDLMVARRTAPVVGMAFRLVARGIAAKVKGRDIGKGLVALARKVAGKAPMREFLTRLDAHMDQQIAALRERPARLQTVRDQAEALEVIYASTTPATLEALVAAVEGIFDDNGGIVTLSTIHRAKGLEADRVFLLDADRVRIPTRSAWQAEQEANLHYVALTRSKEALFIVP